MLGGSVGNSNSGGIVGTNLSANYFLLKTENIEPLVELTHQLNQQVQQNEKRLSQLNYVIDHKLKFPTVGKDDGKNSEGIISKEEAQVENDSTGDSNVDTLRYLLVKKYHLPQDTENENGNENENENENVNGDDKSINISKLDRIRQLARDNEYLNELLRQKKQSNQELARVIQDYEKFIIDIILPKLRQEKLIKSSSGDVSIKKMMDEKFSKIDIIYKRYNGIIMKLVSINNVLNDLISVLNHQDNHTHFISYQLEVLKSLKRDISQFQYAPE
ncbi:uncharacterized protein RJT21DRAFT_112890 [Scheffersomyces amazonensis]|uniref:uncharacterized protein n=1 Tax=Scheffersomyces amazonensis TaxID=1078765 RepID=UPI00315D0125